MKTHLITFGGPTRDYHERVKILCTEAKNSGFFDYVKGYTESDFDEQFLINHKQFLVDNRRGFGYWLWKSYIIYNHMKSHSSYGDIIIYVDAGCTINKDGIIRYKEYIDLLTNSNKSILAFQMKTLQENMYTKSLLFDAMQTCTDDQISDQYHATIILFKNNNKSINIVNEWYYLSSQYSLINDTNSNNIQHRHDQSIFSLLVKKNNIDCITLNDETYFPGFSCSLSKLYPFWATRIRSAPEYTNHQSMLSQFMSSVLYSRK
jgi:hypothetical protein